MRVWHSPWSWLNEIVALDSVAGNTLMGMFTRLILRYPFQVALAAICLSLIGCTVQAADLNFTPRLFHPAHPNPGLCPQNGFRAPRSCPATGAGRPRICHLAR